MEYRITETTEVREKRWSNLEAVLCDAIRKCQENPLNRAKEMAVSLDTDTLSLVAKYERQQLIDLPLPAKTAGEHLSSSLYTGSIRRLIDLGAIKVVSTPDVGYSWTYDGRSMIKEVRKLHPLILPLYRGEMEQK